MGRGCMCCVKGSVGDVRTGGDGGGKKGGYMETMAAFGGKGAETMVETGEKGVEDGSVGGGGDGGGGEDGKETVKEGVG